MTESTGSKTLFRDSKFGNFANGAAVAVALYIADAAAGLDVTPLPDAIEPLALAAVGTVVGLLTSWATARRKGTSRPSSTERPTY